MRVRVRARVHTHFGQGLHARTVQVILGITDYVKFGFPRILFNFPLSNLADICCFACPTSTVLSCTLLYAPWEPP